MVQGKQGIHEQNIETGGAIRRPQINITENKTRIERKKKRDEKLK